MASAPPRFLSSRDIVEARCSEALKKEKYYREEFSISVRWIAINISGVREFIVFISMEGGGKAGAISAFGELC
jgi:hypothetical protein